MRCWILAALVCESSTWLLLSRRVTLALLLYALSATTFAHFELNLNVRIFHVEHHAEGLSILVRLPMPYLVADLTGAAGPDGLPAPAPFTRNAMEGERLVHYVDFEQLASDPLGIGRRVAEGLTIDIQDSESEMQVVAVRVHALDHEPGFATLDEAQAVFEAPQAWPDGLVYVGDAVVDTQLLLKTGSSVSRYSLGANLDPGLPDQEQTANVLLYNGPGGLAVFRSSGLLKQPIEVSSSPVAGFGTFIKEGVRHILEGLDHVLFVLCLAVGASGVASLLWRVTGFTLGHSVTLSLGFFGFVPVGAWFIPTVELIIALTIVYAAAVAMRPAAKGHGEYRMFLITAGIGLIHGLGFSFVLQNILKISSPNIWQSLLAFNIGIELGQVLIVAFAAGVIALLVRVTPAGAGVARASIVIGAGLAAIYWSVERTLALATVL
ncbi:MAG: HupE/UreJ family protein [Pseudomonadota bacterium]